MQVIPDQTPLHRAAEDYYNRHGWVCMPLQADSNGLPKRPIVHDWPNIRRYMPDIDALPWGGALGLGLILGPTSSNLAVLDIDSQSLARAIYAILQSHGQPAYAVKTVRKRMHLYVTELEPTPSRKRPIKWQGDAVEIEFKAAGTQVAAPPTPGYALIEDNLHEWQSLDVFWELIDARLQYLHPLEYVPTPVNAKGTAATDPRATWAATVPDGSRNDTLYVEAHRLREAGMGLNEATDILTARIRRSYEAGHEMSDHEIRATISSAYRKGVVNKIADTPGPSELDLI